MANRPAPALALRDGDLEVLTRLTRSSSVRAGLAQRARIVLLVAEGVSNTATAELVGASRPTVIGWRERYESSGLAGLEDGQRPGRPRTIDHAAIVAATLTPPPKKLGVTHWSTRLLGRHLKISDATVAKAWRDYGVQPWRSASFRFSTDPELVAKVVDVVGLYLAPPDNAIVLSIDEKSQIQALERAAPILPLQSGLAERRSHDYIRHGTSTLFAALEIATGKVTATVKPRHRHQEFVSFLSQVARAYPDGDLHLVMDNYAAHKHPAVKRWLIDNPRVHCQFTPTHASWMNLVEVWFSMIERQAIHAAASAPPKSSTPRSAPTSTAGTTAATPSSGPKPPTKSSRRPTVRTLQTQGTLGVQAPSKRLCFITAAVRTVAPGRLSTCDGLLDAHSS